MLQVKAVEKCFHEELIGLSPEPLEVVALSIPYALDDFDHDLFPKERSLSLDALTQACIVVLLDNLSVVQSFTVVIIAKVLLLPRCLLTCLRQ